MKNFFRVSVSVGVFVLAVIVLAHPANAATITVTVTTDDVTNNSNCTLREAIKAANTDLAVDSCTAGSGTDTIILGANTYILSITGTGEDSNATGDLDVTSPIIINGDASDTTLIDAKTTAPAFDDRMFEVRTGGNLTINNAAIELADTTVNGAGILNGGTLALNQVDIDVNTTTGDGGGLYNSSGKTATLSEVNVYFNDANNGAGIYNLGTLNLDRSSSILNLADTQGGGLYNTTGTATLTTTSILGNGTTSGSGAGIFNSATGTISLDSSIIDQNTAGAATSGLVSTAGGTVTITRTILSNNADNVGFSDCSGTVASSGYNLIETNGCTITGTTTGNLTGVDPKVGILDVTTNGVFFETLVYGSPAIEAAGATCLATDVAGTTRPQRGTHAVVALCDMGPWEYIVDETPPTVTAHADVTGTTTNTNPVISIASNEAGTLTFTCSNWTSVTTSVIVGTTDARLNTLTDGDYSCYAQVTDIAQNVGTSAAITFKLDRSPTLTVVTPVPAYTNNPKATVTVSKASTLTFLGCAGSPMSGTGTIVVTLSGFTEGTDRTCSVRATGTDVGSNSAFVSLGTFTYDVTPPTLALVGDSNRVLPLYSLNDPGAIAYDSLSGVDSTGVVATRLPYSGNRINNASYYGYNDIKYTVSDKAGNVATPLLFRSDVLQPKVETINFSHGSFTITRPNGSKVSVTPFGQNFSVPTIGRKVTFVKDVWVVYYVMTIGPTSKWQLKMYDVQGAAIKSVTYPGGPATPLTLPSSFTSRGVNWAAAYDPMTNNYCVALGSKLGVNVPKVFCIRPYSDRKVAKYHVGWSTMTQKTTPTKGNVLVRFISLDSFGLTLVSNANGKTRAWKGGFGNYNSDYKENTNISSSRFVVVNGAIKQLAPTIVDFQVTPISPGTTTLRWIFDKPVTVIITSKTEVKQSNVSADHSATFQVTPNTYNGVTVTACVKGLPAAAGCSTSFSKWFKTL